MKAKILHDGNHRHAILFVGIVWLIMMMMALTCFMAYGRNIPLAEDWLLVAPMTGNEPDLLGWLWAQNNEHRIPLPRFLLLGLLMLTKGNFRVGMLFNILMLSSISLILIMVARHLRGGRTKFVDAFFPLTLLHLGHWPNLFWNWQLTQVLPTILTCIFLVLFICQPSLSTTTAALTAGICLVMLPLCGANGLLLTPFLAIWVGCSGIRQIRSNDHPQPSWISYFLLGSAMFALLLTGLYFIGYESPSWNPPNPGLSPTLKTTAKFLAYGFGPVAARFWDFFILAAFCYLLPSLGILIIAPLRHQGFERQRALGLLWFFTIMLFFALAIGYGRAGSIATQGFPIRYVLFAVPVFCAGFFVWELYGQPRLKALFQQGLLIGMLLLLPLNMIAGFAWFGNWYDQGMNHIERDIASGATALELAQRHRSFLVHWWDEQKLAEHIDMLYEHRISPFSEIKHSDNSR